MAFGREMLSFSYAKILPDSRRQALDVSRNTR